DWGQDILYLKKWMDAHSDISPSCVHVSNGATASALGISNTHVHRSSCRHRRAKRSSGEVDVVPVTGHCIFSLKQLYSPYSRLILRHLLERGRLVDRIGSSIVVIEFDAG